ncbi:MAG: DUF2780 domain-containing protein, partial [bacterium]
MDSIQDFIAQAAGNLGISVNSARSTTSGLLDLIKSQVADADGQEFIAKIPGAANLMAQAPQAAAASEGGSVLGGLMGKAGDLLGGNIGSKLGVMGLFKHSGLSGDQAGSFVSMFF